MTELPRRGSVYSGNRAMAIAALVPLALALAAMEAKAQSIVPAADGTATQVTPRGDGFDIGGGQLSKDGANLFHSFDRFGLESGQVANFLSNPDIANIFGRVVGGEASYINGLLQVSGGNSNLYLMNPAGIVFGANASLNVPADFTATTATGIGFAAQNAFSAFGDNPWANLVGNPTALTFALEHPGVLVNAGNLTVLPGSHLGLVGGVVVNTGTLQAPQGGITVTAVPGQSLVRLSALGNVLSLEVSSQAIAIPGQPLTLPELLSGGGVAQQSRLVANADGTASIIGSGWHVDPQTGTAIASGRISVSGDSGSIAPTPTVQVLGDRIVLENAQIEASGTYGGGTIFIGGDFRGTGTLPTSQSTVVDSQTSIVADALQQGNGGRVIVWADGTAGFFGNISARGGLTAGDGGFVEVSGKQNLIFDGTVDLTAARGNLGTLLLDPTNITISNDPSAPAEVEALLPEILAGAIAAEEVTLNAETLSSQTGNVVLEATNDITITSGTSLTFVPGDGSIAFKANSDGVDGGSFSMGTQDNIITQGRNLSISGITIATGTLDTSVPRDASGDGGDISLSAVGDITTQDLFATSMYGVGGDLTLTSSNGAIDTTNGSLYTTSDLGSGGTISLQAAQDITTGNLNSTSVESSSGDIELVSTRGTVDTTGGTIDVGDGNLAVRSGGGSVAVGNITIEDGGVEDVLNPSHPNVIADADSVNPLTGSVTLAAHNDITLNEAIVSSTLSSLELSAGRSIHLNADIDTSGGNGSIILRANNGSVADGLRESGLGNVNQAPGTVLNAGSGDISVQLVNPELRGNITIADVRTTGTVNVNANGGNIQPAAADSLIAAGLARFETTRAGEGGLGSPTAPLRLDVDRLEATSGRGGMFFDAQRSLELGQLSTSGDINIAANGKLDITDTFDVEFASEISLSATEDITLGEQSQSCAASSSNCWELSFPQYNGFAGGGAVSFIADRDGDGKGDFSFADTDDAISARFRPVTISGANIALGDVYTNSRTGHGGDLTLIAGARIQTGTLTTGTGDGDGGNINLKLTGTGGEIVTENLAPRTYYHGSAGDVTVDANGGSVTIGNIEGEANVANELTQRGANITIRNASTITTGDLNTGNGNADVVPGQIDAASGGSIDLSADGDITTGTINTAGILQGGEIKITSARGSIDTRAGIVQSRSLEGDAGSVTFEAGGSIFTQDILSDGAKTGNAIALSSRGGTILTEALNSYSASGTAGSVTLNALNHIATGDISSYSQSGTGGAVDIFSTQGNLVLGDIATYTQSDGDGGGITLQSDLDTASSVQVGNLRTESGGGVGGNIQVSAFSSVSTADITTFSSLDSGNIAIEIVDSNGGDIQTGNITTETTAGVSGDITINGFNIATGNVSSIGSTGSGDITIDADGTLTTLDISTATETGDAGDIDLDAKGDIHTGDITSSGGGNSGTISVISREGSVTTGDITSQAGTGTPGAIEVSAAGDVETGNTTSAGATTIAEGGLDTPTGEIQTPEVTTETAEVSTHSAVLGEAETLGTVAGRPGSYSQGDLVNDPSVPTEDLPSIAPESQTRISDVARDSSLNPGVVLTGSSQRSNGRDLAAAGGDRTDSMVPSTSDAVVLNPIDSIVSSAVTLEPSEMVELEQERNGDFAGYFGEDFQERSVSVESTRTAMATIAEETGYQSAIVYVTLLDDRLELVVLTAGSQPLRYVVPDVSREQVLGAASELRGTLTSPRWRNTDKYLKSAQQLYRWLIAPLQSQLETAGVNTLLFSMDEGLRSLPIAALHDGERFLVEQYSLSLIPSIGSIDTRYQSVRNSRVLAMGASQFTELNPLPAVPVELSTITQRISSGKALLDGEFTQANLRHQRQEYPYSIVHFATHGEFKPGNSSESFIQLWNEKLTLDRLRELGLNKPPVELLVLSACRTAVGDARAELGFAGLAVAAGAKSALASLWDVSDGGTLGLMTEFYFFLTHSSIKAEALRQAQIAMLRGQVRVESGRLVGNAVTEGVALPPALSDLDNTDFSHPYYWSAFTLIGSPW